MKKTVTEDVILSTKKLHLHSSINNDQGHKNLVMLNSIDSVYKMKYKENKRSRDLSLLAITFEKKR